MKHHSRRSTAFFFFSNTAVSGQVLMHSFLISKENIVLWKLWCFTQTRKFCFVFSFHLFAIVPECFQLKHLQTSILLFYHFKLFPLETSERHLQLPTYQSSSVSFRNTCKIICLEVKIDLHPKDNFSCTFTFSLWPRVMPGWWPLPVRESAHAASYAYWDCLELADWKEKFLSCGESKISGGQGTGSGVNQRKDKQLMEANKNVVTLACRRRRLNLSWELRWTDRWFWEPQGEKWRAGCSLHGQRGCLSLGADGMAAQARQQAQGARRYLRTPKAAATRVNKRIHGLRGGRAEVDNLWSEVHLCDLLLRLYGHPLPTILSFALVSSICGYRGLAMALEIIKSKVVPPGSFLQLCLWFLGITTCL